MMEINTPVRFLIIARMVKLRNYNRKKGVANGVMRAVEALFIVYK
jgi:hypothetical protein